MTLTSPEHLSAVWTAMAEGADRTGHLRDSDHDTAACVAQNALASACNVAGYVVVKDDPHHVVELTPAGWTLQHSLSCRLSGSLFDCPMNVAVRNVMRAVDGPATFGRFIATVDDDGLLNLSDLPS